VSRLSGHCVLWLLRTTKQVEGQELRSLIGVLALVSTGTAPTTSRPRCCELDGVAPASSRPKLAPL
jgi:hypothetical protein